MRCRSRCHSQLKHRESGLVCDPCCMVVPLLGKPTSIIHTSLLGFLEPVPSSSASAITAWQTFTSGVSQPSTTAAMMSSEWALGGSGITTLSQTGSQSALPSTVSAPPISSVPRLLPSNTHSAGLSAVIGEGTSSQTTQSPLPSSTIHTTSSSPSTNSRTAKPSATLIAVIAIASFLGLLSLVLGILLYIRLRRPPHGPRSRQLSHAETGNLASLNRSHNFPGRALSVVGSTFQSTLAPSRPRNPFEGIVPPDTPLLPPDPTPPVIHLNVSSPRLRTAAGWE
ncbi:hypothetical protein J3A83DRAFT_3570678 [Scleroderma citrinum]